MNQPEFLTSKEDSNTLRRCYERLITAFNESMSLTAQFVSTLELCHNPDFHPPDEIVHVCRDLFSETKQVGQIVYPQLLDVVKHLRSALDNFRVMDSFEV